MANCELCQQPAGLFRKEHAACVARRDAGWLEMVSIVKAAAAAGATPDTLEERLSSLAASSYIDRGSIRESMIEGWEAAVDQLLEDGVLTVQEEGALVAFKERFSLTQADLDGSGAYSRILKAAILRELLEGKVPQRIRLSGTLPFNLQKSEQLVYLFQPVNYFEDKTRTHYVGASQGMSVRVMKGVYYRFGAFRGNPIHTTERVQVDSGLLGVTTKHVYFFGRRKSFRVRHDKIVSFMPFSDGVGIVKDSASATPQIFVTGDGWFAFNLLSNISRLLNDD